MAAGQCAICNAPTSLFKNGKLRKRCDLHATAGGRHTPTEARDEKMREYRKEYRLRHPGRMSEEWQRRRAARHAQERGGTLSRARAIEMRTSATHCHYCLAPISFELATIDHVIPLSKGGEHSESNVVVACRACNSRKQDKAPKSRVPAGAMRGGCDEPRFFPSASAPTGLIGRPSRLAPDRFTGVCYDHSGRHSGA